MKTLCILLVCWGVPALAALPPQHDTRIDSLQKLLTTAPPDSNRVLLLAQLAYEHTQTAPLATIAYGQQALQLAQKLRFARGEAWALVRLGSGFREAGNYPAALQVGLQGLRMAEALHDSELMGRATNALGYLSWEQGYSRQALGYLFRAKAVAEKSHNTKLLTRVMGNIGNVYVQLNRLDSALLYSRQGYALDLSQRDLTSEVGDAAMLGNIYTGLGNPKLALRYYRSSITRATGQHITFALCRAYLGQARLYQRQYGPHSDSALYSGRMALGAGQQGHYPKGILEASQFLASVYAARRDSATAFRYLTLASTTRDSLFSRTKVAQVQALDVSERLRQQERADEAAEAADERRYHWMLAALVSTIPVLLLLWRNNRQKQLANQQLNAQNAQIADQRDELSRTLVQLQDTQAQLVQREKMAFLGELTAGIAHELQNPLNFVKNFAEVSADLVEDMRAEAGGAGGSGNGGGGSGGRASALEQEILAGLKQNLQKISQHGQRATAIIQGMLEHSRTGTGRREPADVNALCDEGLRLAYQGLRTKDKGFTATLTTAFDPALPPVPVVAQDLSRVLINLCTNAFYALKQRQLAAGPGYAPELWLGTRAAAGGRVEIRVRDNGTGMGPDVLARLFHPFFTTKPVGEGTGLGLSLSHDIVTQGHGGTLAVESELGVGTEFTISLPLVPATPQAEEEPANQ